MNTLIVAPLNKEFIMGYDEWKDGYKANLDTIKSLASLMYKADSFPLYLLLGDEGNIKIPNTTAIFNMASAKHCPSKKLGLCKAESQGAVCYAAKAERLYPLVLPYREKQAKFWSGITAEEFAFQFLMINSFKRQPFNLLRLNESGDFHNQECVDKAEKIARILKKHGIICYCYTSRSDLDYHKIEALRISGSGFKKDGIVNVFKIIKSKKDRPRGFSMCPMNCRKCNRCSKSRMSTCVVKH